jgi:NAD(P)-dependent dehydrogenase (short-subunit alcohol dehydrogenase family)
MLGPLYFTRVASVYLRLPPSDPKHAPFAFAGNRSILLTSSSAGFFGYAPIPLYSITKHALMGLMRALRQSLHPATNIRINTVNPFVTNTALTKLFHDYWVTDKGLPMNQPEDVARVMVQILRCHTEEKGMEVNGKAFYVEGGKAWETEDKLKELQGEWLGSKDHDRQADVFSSMRLGGEKEY